MIERLIYCTFFTVSSFVSIAQSDALVEEYDHRFNVYNYTVPYKELTPEKPITALASGKISKDSYLIIPSIDTIKIEHIWDSVANPVAFSFKGVGFLQSFIAVKRKNDWLLLHWKAFRGLRYFGDLKLSWIDFNGIGSPELLVTLDQTKEDGSIEQIFGSMENSVTGQAFYTDSRWRKATGFCIIDIDAVSFLADNILTGYEYRFALKEKEKNSSGIAIGFKNKSEKYFKVWYRFDLQPEKKQIVVELKECEQGVISDSSVIYFHTPEKSEKPNEKVLELIESCTLMYKEGIYVLRNGQFLCE